MISYSINALNKNILYSPLGFTLFLNFSNENNTYQISNSNLNQGQTLDKVQSVYIDNSNSSVNTIIQVQKTGQKIIIPAFGILSWSLMLSQNDLITFSNASATSTLVTIILTDRNLPAVEYNALGNYVNSDFTIAGSLTVGNNATFTGMVLANGGLETTSFTANAAAYFNGTLKAIMGITANTISTTSKATLASLDAINSATIGKTLNVVSSANLQRANIASNLIISGIVSAMGSTNLHGLLTASGGISANNLTVVSSATAGTAKFVSNPVGYIEITINGTVQKIPYFN